MRMIVVTCPHCAGKFQGNDSLHGTTAVCPTCRKPFTIPRQQIAAATSAGPASPGMSPEGKQTLKIIGIILGVMSVVFGCPIGCCFVGRILVFRAAESAAEFRLKYHDRLEAFARSELERRGCRDIDYRFSPSYDGQQAGGYLMSLVGTCDYRKDERSDFKVEMLIVDEDIRMRSIRIDGTDVP